MRRIQRYHALSVLGDLKPHPYDWVINIGSLHISNPLNRSEIWGMERVPRNMYVTDLFQSWVKQLINDGLINVVENENVRAIKLQRCGHETHPAPDGKVCLSNHISPRDYDLQLSTKGRDCLVGEQIARSGDYSYYKNFDGTIDSAKKINPGLFK